MKEKKMGNVRDWGLNKDVCGASREYGVQKSGSQGLQSRAKASGSALTERR